METHINFQLECIVHWILEACFSERAGIPNASSPAMCSCKVLLRGITYKLRERLIISRFLGLAAL